MTKKKKVDLSPEEKLEQALVPVGEHPYEIPDNWVWVRFGELAVDIADGPFGSNLKREHYTDNHEVRIIQLSNIGDNGWKEKNIKYTTFDHLETISRSRVFPGQLVIAKMMPAGRAIIVPDLEKAYVLSSDAIKFVPYDRLNIYYLLYGINSTDFRNQVSCDTQGVTRARTSIKKLRNYSFPLPPLSEQQRIVERIESLFEKLDQAKELIQESLDSFENRKAAILHKAFTGELTKKWREENGVSLESWEERELGDYTEIKYGYTESACFNNIGPNFLRITDIQDGIVNWDEVPHCPISNEDYNKYRLNVGDIVVARTGATTGKSYLIVDEVDSVFASYLVRIEVVKSHILNYRYLYLFLQSQKYWKQITELKSGIAQPGVNAKKLKSIIIPIPQIDEQIKIVELLDNLLNKENRCEFISDVEEMIETMKKSILARAFRGELGTNDTMEESAIELLKSIVNE